MGIDERTASVPFPLDGCKRMSVGSGHERQDKLSLCVKYL